ncbi:hypothetical protein [Lactococcus garvieae]|uniref:hypothetical protein n=1 Tax=Lactococcus garvieae TaxID=1363 RepID=UPI0022E7513F|nr:hypothetical protein [Lactococcus garvieae]
MVFNKLDDLSTNEIILMEGRANWDTPFNAKGGKLFLTNKRIIFKANKLNFGTKYFECNLDDVYIENNTVPIFVIWNIFSFTISLKTKNGEVQSFVVTNSDINLWIERISEAVLDLIQNKMTIPETVSETEKQNVKSSVNVISCGGCGAFIITISGNPTKCNYCGRIVK